MPFYSCSWLYRVSYGSTWFLRASATLSLPSAAFLLFSPAVSAPEQHSFIYRHSRFSAAAAADSFSLMLPFTAVSFWTQFFLAYMGFLLPGFGYGWLPRHGLVYNWITLLVWFWIWFSLPFAPATHVTRLPAR